MVLQQKRKDLVKYFVYIAWVVAIGVLGRLIPHLPNMTPLVGIGLFIGATMSRRVAMFAMLMALLISDICLAALLGYPIVGYFTLFTYTGFIMVTFIGSKIGYIRKIFPFYVLGSSCVFWLWVNFGVWLTSGMYPKTLTGLGFCYYMALPFLRNALFGDLIWASVIFGGFFLLLKKNPSLNKFSAFSMSNSD